MDATNIFEFLLTTSLYPAISAFLPHVCSSSSRDLTSSLRCFLTKSTWSIMFRLLPSHFLQAFVTSFSPRRAICWICSLTFQFKYSVFKELTSSSISVSREFQSSDTVPRQLTAILYSGYALRFYPDSI